METIVEFSSLDEAVQFLNSPIGDERQLKLYSKGHVYRLTGNSQVYIGDRSAGLDFLGTNHTSMRTLAERLSDGEKEAIDDFLQKMPPVRRLLIEVGSFNTENTFDKLVRDMSKNTPPIAPDLLYMLDPMNDTTELAYAADNAHNRGIKSRNMDLYANPAAIPHLTGVLTKRQIIEYLCMSVEYCMDDERASHKRIASVRNEIVRDILVRYFPKLCPEAEKAFKLKKYQQTLVIGKEYSKDYVNGDCRDEFMAGEVVTEAKSRGNATFLAHTLHIIRILQKLEQAGTFASFSARADFAPEVYEYFNTPPTYR